MTHIFRRIGWNAHQLESGYKAYRTLVLKQLAELPARMTFKVVCGATGSGKSRILQALAQRGEQVLDLEDLACHKGSVLGVLPGSEQPSQKMFETRLHLALQSFDPTRPVYVEAESRKIGCIHLPDALLDAMRAGACITIDASFEARVEFLLRDYDYFLNNPEWFNSRLGVLDNLHSRETIQRWQDYANAAQWKTLVCELLELHYDPLYRRSQNRNFAGLDTSTTFTTNDLSPAGIDALTGKIENH